MRKLKDRKHVFVASGLKEDFVPIQKIEDHNGVKYLLTPIFKPVIDVYPSRKIYPGNFNIQYQDGNTNTLDFRFANPDDHIIIGKTDRNEAMKDKNITNIFINADNLDTTSLYGKQTYNLTVQNYASKKIFAFQQNFYSFIERNKHNIESINFEGFGENYLSYIMKTCNDFGVDYSIYIDQNEINQPQF